MSNKNHKTWEQVNHDNLLAEVGWLKKKLLAQAQQSPSAGKVSHQLHRQSARDEMNVATELVSGSSRIAASEPGGQSGVSAENNEDGIAAGICPTPEGTPFMLNNLCTLFSLCHFDRQLLLLCAAVEIDGEVAKLCEQMSGQPYPTLALALAVFSGHYAALAPTAPLRYYQLVEQKADHHSLMRQSLSISPWALYYLTAAPSIDPILQTLLQPVNLWRPILPSHRLQAQQLRQGWNRQWPSEPVVTQLIGVSGDDESQVVALAAVEQDRRVYQLNLLQLPLDNAELDRYGRLLEREVIAQNGLLLINCQRLQGNEGEANLYLLSAWLDNLIWRLPNACVLAADQAITLPSVQVHYRQLSKISQAEQIQLWQYCLSNRPDNVEESTAEGAMKGAMEGAIESTVQSTLESTTPEQADIDKQANSALTATLQQLSAQFHLNGRQLRNIVHQVRRQSPLDSQQLSQQLWQHCRQHCRQHLQGMAKIITPSTLDWNHLILPASEIEMLKAILAQVKQRQRVYQQWGFAEQTPYGLGISALFTGSSGTGKTMAARIIASCLQLDLYHVDLSSVVDKYIGETEKKLDKIFQAAENSGAILLFDEADALFGKRSKVQDARDRYANMGISFLLQRMESYTGLSILTTNLRSAMDDAFLRRLRFIVPFPFPKQSERERLWRLMIPNSAPQHGIDSGKLARLKLSGGSIRSIAMQAAFTAAEADQPITMQHLLQAARQQYLKVEKTLDEKLVTDWHG